MEVDLLCMDAQLAIELDGAQHLGNAEAYRRDRRKDALLQENGYTVLRCLYLGWLAGLQSDDCDEEALEPPVPPGLDQLNPALENLADFLRIDQDLITAASKLSPSLEQNTPDLHDIQGWIATLANNEKDALLANVLESSIKGDQAPSIKLVHRFNKSWQANKADTLKRQRTIDELLKETESITLSRRRKEAEKAAQANAEQERLNRLAREKRLNEITGREPLLWDQIESLACEKKASSYDKALELLIDLRDLATKSNSQEFLLKLNALKQRHSAKSSFINRLRSIG
ncbi:MAG: hypothetical protein ACD_17C00064G0001 [uncultured bacterium]|nr:MAG: hypothetical protein ACD_17C00064G0001 [uncultured bacterium]